ncbi:Oligopeptide transport system permease protein AppC [Adhaeribacter pallidiroseus]|uniref:Oligopeptide transport system permease protein AppC n=2 Tax=Adhaeribacter pallidiroseus TaxID=2072847 RepID=A0A369QM70_9BACT|nr:Oligopeptide transport system permease protein AppC [Adhaeribacter pallidiroseus]
MFGLAVIVFASLIAVLGYLIMPDASPNANNSLVQLQKKEPGFSVKMLRIKKPNNPAPTNPWQKWLFGEELPYEEIPLQSFQIAGSFIRINPYINVHALPDKIRIFRVNEVFGFKLSNLDLPELSGAAALEQKVMKEAVIHKMYWLGTDRAGRDVLSRLLLGTRISLGIGLIAVLISVSLGILVGAAAGYFGGLVDKAMLFLITVVWSIPGIMLVIAISLAFDSRGVWVSFVAVGLTMWVDVARIVRGQFLSLKEKTYIEAGKVLGLPQNRLIFRHILPNMIGPLIVIGTANFAAAILMEAGLSFLGLGVQPPAPSWGMMVNEGFQLIGTRAGLYLVLLPSLCISMLVLSFNLLGNGLRDAYDPKLLINNA